MTKDYAGRRKRGPRETEAVLAAKEWQRFKPQFVEWAKQYWPEAVAPRKTARIASA